jgi:hypothetical protein
MALQLSTALAFPGEAVLLDKREVPGNRYNVWRNHAIKLVAGGKLGFGKGGSLAEVPIPELTWECKPERIPSSQEGGKWVATVKLQATQEAVDGRLPGTATVELVRSLDNTMLTDASSSARGVCWSSVSEPIGFAALAPRARAIDVTLAVLISAEACQVSDTEWKTVDWPILACRYRNEPVSFCSNRVNLRLLTTT